MIPRIVNLGGKRVVGIRGRMSLAQDRTRELWQAFMPRRGEVRHRIGRGYLSLQVFDRPPDRGFTPDTPFEKWAAVEVAALDAVPPGMEGGTLPPGDYAVFVHRGPADTFHRTLHHIFRVWLPASGYGLDDRVHFTVMDENYRPDDPDGAEEIWIPVREARP